MLIYMHKILTPDTDVDMLYIPIKVSSDKFWRCCVIDCSVTWELCYDLPRMASNIARRVEASHFEQRKEKKHGNLKENKFHGQRQYLSVGFR